MWIAIYMAIMISLMVIAFHLISEALLEESAYLWGIFICFGLVAIGAWILISDWKQDIDPESIKYYSCKVIELPDELPKLVCITSSDMRYINDFDLYHPGKTIVKEYTYIPKKGWVDWMNGETYHYDVILPNDEEYNEIKDKVITVVIK